MGFNPPVPQQDSNWEIRVAVLLSLLLQVILIFLGPMRRRSSALWSRLTVWSCYLLADWVADLALGLILNNMGNIVGGNSSSSFGLKRGGATPSSSNASGSGSPTIFAFWTPFLLLHLGGPDTITAYSVEDNELWLRHLIGLLFGLFSACVIFFCSLQGNPLIHATLLMFVVGIIKYGERTYSLYCGSLEIFRNNILGPPVAGRSYAKFMTELDSKKKAGLVVEVAIPNGEASLAHREMEVQEMTRLVSKDKSVEARAYDFFLMFRRLFVNLILSAKEQRQSQAFFLERAGEAFEVIEMELNFIYDMVYTKAPVAYTMAGWVLRSVCSACLVSALLIFFFLDKPRHQIQHVDVVITYALLLGGLALDLVALLMLIFSNRAKVYLEVAAESQSSPLRWFARVCLIAKRWRPPVRWSGSGTTSQFNLISYCLGMPVEGILQDLIFIRRVALSNKQWRQEYSPPLLDFIFAGLKPAAEHLKVEGKHLKVKGKEKIIEMLTRRVVDIKDAIRMDNVTERLATDIVMKLLEKKDEPAEVMKAEAERHGLAMDDLDMNNPTDTSKIKAKIVEQKFQLILDSVLQSDITDFDDLLQWHIATDLCLLVEKQGPISRQQDISKTLSEYMLYLLIKQPEMLSATSGMWLMRYRDTCEEARRFFASMEPWIQDHNDARRMLLSINTSVKPSVVKGDESKSVLFDAVILAKELRKLEGDLRWYVISGVWGEILTYAAGKCPGSTHVKQLNRGGELITIIWLLMEHMGLGDMYNINTGDAAAKIIVHDH